jgi:hypothetical protein
MHSSKQVQELNRYVSKAEEALEATMRALSNIWRATDSKQQQQLKGQQWHTVVEVLCMPPVM